MVRARRKPLGRLGRRRCTLMGVSWIAPNKHKFKIRRKSLALSHTFPEGTGRVAFILVKQHKLGELWAWARSSALKADPATDEAPAEEP